MSLPVCGHNGYIYVSGIALAGANAWSIDVATETVELRKFGDDWIDKCVTFNSWSGSIDAIDDIQTLLNAAKAGDSLPLYIYPDRATTGEYYSGNAIFGHGASADTSSPVGVSSSFEGDGALTWTE